MTMDVALGTHGSQREPRNVALPRGASYLTASGQVGSRARYGSSSAPRP